MVLKKESEISKKFSKQLNVIEENIKSSFHKVKDELDEHLHAINENTDEISIEHEHICKLEHKMDKLAERMDQMQLMMKQLIQHQMRNGFSVELTKDEQKVFLVVYAFGEQTNLSYADIARKTDLNELQIKHLIDRMIAKGVSITEETLNGQSFFNLDQKFREMQAKQKLIEISSVVHNQVFNRKIVV
ncbi:hypothetical protein ACFL0W_06695 [Nanoarchaeota archaeon]